MRHRWGEKEQWVFTKRADNLHKIVRSCNMTFMQLQNKKNSQMSVEVRDSKINREYKKCATLHLRQMHTH